MRSEALTEPPAEAPTTPPPAASRRATGLHETGNAATVPFLEPWVASPGKWIARWVAVIAAGAIAVGYLRFIGVRSPDHAFSFLILCYFLSFFFAGILRPSRRRPLPAGRVIAVIPAYNENPRLLEGAIRSLLNGTVVPDVIHVVDDGSVTPLKPFEHPRVVWHQRENGGKHHAQATALLAELEHFDFVVTVDSDSVVDRHAVERCLRPMSDPRVQGVTGVVYALNRDENVLTRVTDLHYVHSCLIVRGGLSATGDIFTASGALAAWRSGVVMDNLTEYLDRGVADDRHLTHFAQRRGRTAAAADAYVYTNVPSNAPDLFRQRIRWARDYYRCVILDIRYLRGWSFWMRSTDFAFMCLAPLFAITALMVFPFAQWQIPWTGVALWIAFLYAQTFCYVLDRQRVSLRERLVTWLLFTPALYLFQLIVVGPAMVAGLLNVRHRSWQTRENRKPAANPIVKLTPARGEVANVVAGRSRYLDTLRMLAISRVVLFHATGLVPLGFVFPSMGIMFALGGSLMARSMAKAGDRPEIAIWNRFRRLMPSLWMLAIVLIPVMMITGWTEADQRPLSAPGVLAWVFPLSDPPSNDWAIPIAGVLWYIRTYLWLVIGSGALWSFYRRRPIIAVLLPLLLIPLAPHIGFSSWLSDVTLQVGTYAPCWVLGFWHATGRLKRIPAIVAYPLAGLFLVVAYTWVHLFPPSGGYLQSSPIGQVACSTAFILVLFRFDPKMTWAQRCRPIGWLIDKVNARCVTIYLWHQLAILASATILERAGVYRRHDLFLSVTMKTLIIISLVVAACWLVGWIEDITGPGSTRTRGSGTGKHNQEVALSLNPALEPGQTAIISGLAAAVVRHEPGRFVSDPVVIGPREPVHRASAPRIVSHDEPFARNRCGVHRDDR